MCGPATPRKHDSSAAAVAPPICGADINLPTQDAAGRITCLDASKSQLLSLQEISTQLQQLTSLQQLVLARNRLADICGLELLLDLRVLNLARNRIQDLQPLEVRNPTRCSSRSVWSAGACKSQHQPTQHMPAQHGDVRLACPRLLLLAPVYDG